MNKAFLIVLTCAALAFVVGYFWYLKDRDSAFPYLYNPANHPVTDADIGQIKQLIHDKGERFLVSVNIVNVNKAGATTGHDSLRPRSGRSYTFERTEGGWKIAKVEDWKN